MTWVDDQVTHSEACPWLLATIMRQSLNRYPDHLIFTGVNFKYQHPEPNPLVAAKKAIAFSFIPTTSGPKTGEPPDLLTVQTLRTGLTPTAPLAVASGITPDNASSFAPYLSHILVATAISATDHTFCSDKLGQLMQRANA